MTGLLCVKAIRAIEQAASQDLPTGALMERAAEATAAQAARLLRRMPAQTPVIALAGPGNNGGDALIAALKLRQRGFSVRTLAIAPVSAQAPDAQWAWGEAQRAGLAPTLVHEPSQTLTIAQVQSSLFIDGLFGIGLTRPLDGPALRWCQMLNEHRAAVIAIDVPSGIDADRGCVVGGSQAAAIRASHTVTMIADKPGLHTGIALDHVGQLSVADLNLSYRGPSLLSADSEHIGQLLNADAVVDWIPRRLADSHKGSFGTVRVIGGAPGMRGAALLAARAAQSVGAGKVVIESGDTGLHETGLHDPGQPQLMIASPGQTLVGVDAIVIGCGLGLTDWARQRLNDALTAQAALVVDADALNIIADTGFMTHGAQAIKRRAASVITPHPLEAARLLGTPVRQIQSDRISAARTLAKQLGVVVVLKGAGTVIADPTNRWAVSEAGDASLASAGTGDVLAGAIAGLMAQGLDAWQASCLGVWSHGSAGQRWRATEGLAAIGLSATELPVLMRTVLNRSALTSGQ